MRARALAAGAVLGAGGVGVALLCAVGGVVAAVMNEDLDEDDEETTGG